MATRRWLRFAAAALISVLATATLGVGGLFLYMVSIWCGGEPGSVCPVCDYRDAIGARVLAWPFLVTAALTTDQLLCKVHHLSSFVGWLGGFFLWSYYAAIVAGARFAGVRFRVILTFGVLCLMWVAGRFAAGHGSEWSLLLEYSAMGLMVIYALLI